MSKPPPAMPPQPQPTQVSQPPKKSKLWLFILLGFVGIFLLCLCITPFLLLPAVQQVREVARTNVAEDNARSIARALHAYEKTHNRFPAAVEPGSNGRPAQSWRVVIMPYLEKVDGDVRSGYDNSKGWQEGINLPLSKRDVDAFNSPRGKTQQQGITHFVGIVGPDTGLSNNGRGNNVAAFRDGISNTIIAIEYIDSDIPWSKPEDISPEKAIEIIKSNKSSLGTIAIFADGHTQKIPHTVQEDVLRAMLTKSGGDLTF